MAGPSFTEAAKKGANSAPPSQRGAGGFEAHDWELYHVDEDYSETHNLAAEHHDKLIEMVGRWWAEAGKYGCCRSTARARTHQRGTSNHRQVETVCLLPRWLTSSVYRRPQGLQPALDHHSRGGDPEGGAEGVLLAQGGNTGGYALFVKDGKLHFLYNWLGHDKFWLHST